MLDTVTNNQDPLGQSGTVIRPTQLTLYLTRQCNLSCPSCLFRLQDKDFFSSSTLTFSSAIAIIDHFFSRQCLNVYLQAEGEVLLYQTYWEIVEYCCAKGIMPNNLITNGILIDRFIPQILQHFTGITISVDGYDPRSYIERRGGTAKMFNRIVDSTKLLVSERLKNNNGFFIAYNCVILESNYRIIPKMIEFAEHLGINRIQFRNFHSYNAGNHLLRPLYDTPEIVRFIEKLKEPTYTVQVKWPELYGKLNTFHCNMLFDTVTVGSDGCFAPCCHIPSDESYGSFFQDPHAYNKGGLVDFRQIFLNAKNREELPWQCHECPRLTSMDAV